MNLLHRPNNLPAGLTPQDLGFDAVQVAWTPFSRNKLAGTLEQHKGLDIWLAIQLEPWWFALEDRFDYLYGWLSGAESALDQRLLGVRLNHEHRAFEYSMLGFANALTVPQGHVYTGRRVAWNNLLQEIRDGLNPVHMLEDPQRDEDLRDLYARLVSWQVERANAQIMGLAGACKAAGMDLLVYPGNAARVQTSPRLLPLEEYTLNPDKLAGHPAVIRELSSWDTFGTEWCQKQAAAVKGRWLFTMQQDRKAGLLPNQGRAGVKLRRNLLNADGKPPKGVGFWSDYDGRTPSVTRQQAYLWAVAEALRGQ